MKKQNIIKISVSAAGIILITSFIISVIKNISIIKSKKDKQ